MCPPATIALISAGVSAIGTYMQMQQQKKMEKDQAKIMQNQTEIKNAELATQKRVDEIRANDEEFARREKLRQGIATSRALQRGRESTSFLALLSADTRRYGLDVGTLRFEQSVRSNKITSQIAINKAGASGVAGQGYATAGAIGALGTMGSAYADYKTATIGGPKVQNTTKSTGSAYSGSPNPFGASKPPNYQ
jgi:hypothetical protein